MTQPLATIRLELDAPPDGSVDAKDIRESLSAVMQVGRHLWLGCDETATLERLTDLGGGRWGEHRTFKISDVLDLPAGADDEVDVEGLAWDPPYLWLIGSHSRKRQKPEPGDDVEAVAKALADVDVDDNRYILARIPLEEDAESGGLVPRRCCPDPRDPGKTLTAARLRGKGSDNALMQAVSKDPHLRKFIRLPGKDNGFDIEGLSAAGGRLFLGLRGPVLRGWAIVLELQPVETKKGGRLKLAPIGPDGREYRKHFLDLDGLGVREITHLGNEMLVLAGPTMDVHAPATVFHWRGAVSAEADSVASGRSLKRVMELPHDVEGPGDHPEGMCRFQAEGLRGDGLLVVYDSPAKRRQRGGALRADVFGMPAAAGGGILSRIVGALGGGGTGGGEPAGSVEARDRGGVPGMEGEDARAPDPPAFRGLSRDEDPEPEVVSPPQPPRPPSEVGGDEPRGRGEYPHWPQNEGWDRNRDQPKWEEGQG
ncbi:MAG TPA: DUF3616 domain-containing protein [Longimicrobium sp.]|nr:DUF3616 domain-containing protein [Longimicrobium sp.]